MLDGKKRIKYLVKKTKKISKFIDKQLQNNFAETTMEKVTKSNVKQLTFSNYPVLTFVVNSPFFI